MTIDGVVVWGNCQAEPLADLLRPVLATVGLTVAAVPAVHLADQADMVRVHELVATSRWLISQPIGDDYPTPTSSTSDLARSLPAGGELIRLPVAYNGSGFPYQVNGHGSDGAKVDAPVTDYDDLRTVVAADRGWDVDKTLAWWPTPAAPDVRDVAAASAAELRRREADLEVQISAAVCAPYAMWTINHPTNRTLGAMAGAVLDRLEIAAEVTLPEREFLSARRTPVEAAVSDALDWGPLPPERRPQWVVDRVETPLATVVAAHLASYQQRPDVVADVLRRYRGRIEALHLG